MAWLERRSPETKREVCHLTVLRVLFQTGVLTLWTAEPRSDSLEAQTNLPGVAAVSGKAWGQSPSQVLPQWVEEEADHLLGAPRKGASDRETWALGKREVL